MAWYGNEIDRDGGDTWHDCWTALGGGCQGGEPAPGDFFKRVFFKHGDQFEWYPSGYLGDGSELDEEDQPAVYDC